MTTTPIQVTAGGFRAWLQSRPAQSRVGERCVPESCPIAVYLRQLGVASAQVFGARTRDEAVIPAYYNADGYDDDMPLEPWCGAFIRLCDEGCGGLSRETALRLLASAVPNE